MQSEAFQADRTGLSGSLFARRRSAGESADETRADPSITGGPPPRTPRLFWRSRLALGTPDNAPGLSGRVLSLGGFGIPAPFGRLGCLLSWSDRDPGEDAAAARRAASERSVTEIGRAHV